MGRLRTGKDPWVCDLPLMYGTALKRDGRFRMQGDTSVVSCK